MKAFRHWIIVGAIAVNMLGFAAITSAQDATATPEATPDVATEAPAAAPYLGVVIEGADGGVTVVEVVADSPAALAGILADDLITALNETPVTEDNIRETVQSFAVGDVVTVAVTRGEESLTLEATLAAAPVETVQPRPGRGMRPNIEILPLNRPLLGIGIKNAVGGALVTSVTADSPAEAAGLLVDDIVTAINGSEITNAEDAARAVAEAANAAEIGEFELTVSVLRGEEALDLTATLVKTDVPAIPDMPGMRERGGRGNRDFGFNFGLPGLQIVPREGEEGGFDVVVPFTPADPAAVTPEVEAALAEIGITITPVEGEEGAYTLTIPAESLGHGGMMLPDLQSLLPEGMEFGFSGPMGRSFRFQVPNLPDGSAPATQDGDSL